MQSVHDLRGLAALAVLLHHVAASAYVAPPRAIARVAELGYHGVTAFFVISGFVLPYSLYRSSYRLEDFGGFITRRFARVEPPYFVTIAAVLLLNLLVATIKHTPFRIDGAQVALHAAYLVPLFGKSWLLSVFWTLCVEFQFYVLIGLCYPLLLRRPVLSAMGCAAAMCFATPGWFPVDQVALGQRENLLLHLPVFMVGILLFLQRERLIAPHAFWVSLALSLVVIAVKSPAATLGATIVASLIIVFVRRSHPVLAFFGDISYSLYLVHLLVILTILPLLSRMSLGWFTMAAIAVAASIGAAMGLWLAVERPAIVWSKRLPQRARTVSAAQGAPA
ncbi:acyltransferase family protein [Sphingomonas sp. MMS24-J45]|uniref:acyltransferase family protein n=1 Tax=Sphingomonas sp. MMS24-J45 TaxID=3238806 RepID=UPI003850010D